MDRIFNILDKLSKNSRVGKMDEFVQHGNTTCLLHTVAVAYYSVRLAEALRIPVHKRELIRGALLHDYFLYDWHDPDNCAKGHGFVHPNIAAKNADKDFKLKSLEREIIKRHMFPLTPIPPTSREAWLVCLVDKWCSVREVFEKNSYKDIDERWKKEFSQLYKELRNNV